MAMGPAEPQSSAAGRIKEPSTEPMIKKGRAIIIRPEPPPKLKSTPEPQPLASCIPMPNINAPINKETDTGAIEPAPSSPHKEAGIKIQAHSPISRKWPEMPIISL